MGSGSHLKRLAMPRSWALPRKITTWISRPRSGAHSLEYCMSISTVIRDVLGYADNAREVRRILHEGKAKVDGRRVRDARRGVGLMDVLTLGDTNYRCILDQNGKLRYHQIPPDQSEWKVCRIEGKSTIKGGKTQLNLHDGRNILVDDPVEFNTGDSVKIQLPDQQILTHIQFEEGAKSYLIGGSHVGTTAEVKEILVKRSSMPNEVLFEGFGTIAKHVFIVDDSTPMPSTEVSQ